MHHTRHLHRWGHSIFFRLLLIFGLSALLLIVLVSTSMHLLSDPDRLHSHVISRNMSHYIEYLAHEWGQPPQPERLRQSAEQLGFNVLVEKDGQRWYSQQPFTAPPMQDLHISNEDKSLAWGTHKGILYIVFLQTPYRYTIAVEHSRLGTNHGWFIFLLALSILVVLGIAHVGVRRLLRPVHDLKAGAEQLGSGQLDHQIALPRHGEFRPVIDAFNNMGQQIQRMLRDKEQLLLDVSHELRSPITRMKLALEFIEETPARAQLDSDLRTMEKMVTELLESARMDNTRQTLQLSTFDLVALIQETTHGLAGQAPGIELNGNPQEIPIEADRERLAIVLRNVLENALKYSQGQGEHVRIEWQENEAIHLSIRDAGPGIPDDELQRVFEPFYRVDKSRQNATGGYGLGLSLCKKIIEAHHGSITASANSPTGTIISINLPRYQSV